MDKQPIGYKAGKPYVLDEKIKKNPKYEHVKGHLNTGLHVEKVQLQSRLE